MNSKQDKAVARITRSCFGGWELSYDHPQQGCIYVARCKTREAAVERAKTLHQFPFWGLTEPLTVPEA